MINIYGLLAQPILIVAAPGDPITVAQIVYWTPALPAS